MRPIRKVVAAVLVVAVVALGVVAVRWWTAGTLIAAGGGSAGSDDGRVSVAFGPGEVEEGTRVAVSTDVDGSAPPAGIRPIGRPFAVDATRGTARTGTVTVGVGVLPAGVDPELVVMMIEDGAGWAVLDTDVAPVDATVTARWPHFSRGFVGVRDAVFDAAGRTRDGTAAAWDWSRDTARDGADWARDKAEDLSAAASGVALRLLGGSTDPASCEPSAVEWIFTGTSEGPFPGALTGCATGQEEGGWPVKIRNGAPFPYLVTLPPDVAGPAATDLLRSMEIEDALLALAWSADGRTVVSSGSEVGLRFSTEVGPRVGISAIADPSTMAVEAAAIMVTVLSRGYTSAARAELKAAIDEVQAGVKAGAHSADDLVNELRQLLRERSSAERTSTAFAAALALAMLDATTCAIGLYQANASFDETLGSFVDDCYSTMVKAITAEVVDETLSYADPRRRANEAKALATGMLAEALDVRELLSTEVAAGLAVITRGGSDYLTARVTATCSGPSCPAPRDGRQLDGVAWADGLRGRLDCAEIDPDVFVQRQDITGDGAAEAVVSYRCLAPAVSGRAPAAFNQVEVVDGTSSPDTLRSLGVLLQAPAPGLSRAEAVQTGVYVREVHLDGATITVGGNVYPYGDVDCPVHYRYRTLRWAGSNFVVVDDRTTEAYSC